MKKLAGIAFAVSLLYSGNAAAGNVLYDNTVLYANQWIMSAGNKYSLWMQGDGNLVMYRADGSVRWSPGQKGWYTIMQGDGNLVLYNSAYTAQFATGTGGHPGAALVIQDDGNLVVYAPYGQGALWSIGGDAVTDPRNPNKPGDVVGRDLDLGPFSGAGHIGVWDGSAVVEAMFGLPNAIRFVSLDSFKSATRYWGAASPNIPFAFTSPFCYYAQCTYNDIDKNSVAANIAIAKHARQIEAIGADYTFYPDATVAALAAYPGTPARRGKYRCDTFVLAAYSASVNWLNYNSAAQVTWSNCVYHLSDYPFMPTTVFDRLKGYN